MPFIFDTNSFRVVRNYYPSQFPSFWERFDVSVEKKEVLSVREVYNEIVTQVKEDWYLSWLKKNREMFLTPSGEEGKFVAEIFGVAHFQQLVDEEHRLKGQHVADPFIIASARACNGVVVTEEVFKQNGARIPNVCQYFKVQCTNVQGFLGASGWKF